LKYLANISSTLSLLLFYFFLNDYLSPLL
jgi:hypothetical protein